MIDNLHPSLEVAPAPTETEHEHAQPVVVKRDKSSGEHLFDIGTYGGLALGANEALSTIIMRSAEHGALKKPYASFQEATTKTPLLKRFSYVNGGRMGFILFATIGGMLTVFPVKFMEDHKGSIVRWLNQKIRGSAVNDPQLQREQEEMDAAPRQTWGSLWKGRITTVLSAIGMDVLVGHSDAASTKLLEKTPLKSFSSMQRAASTSARWIVDVFDPQNKQTRLNARNAAEPYKIQAGEGKWVGRVETASFLMTLSLALTVLFYASSKMFATHREVKKEKKREEDGIPSPNAGVVYQADRGVEHAVLHADHATEQSPSTANDKEPMPLTTKPQNTMPSHHIHAVRHESHGMGHSRHAEVQHLA